VSNLLSGMAACCSDYLALRLLLFNTKL